MCVAQCELKFRLNFVSAGKRLKCDYSAIVPAHFGSSVWQVRCLSLSFLFCCPLAFCCPLCVSVSVLLSAAHVSEFVKQTKMKFRFGPRLISENMAVAQLRRCFAFAGGLNQCHSALGQAEGDDLVVKLLTHNANASSVRVT